MRFARFCHAGFAAVAVLAAAAPARAGTSTNTMDASLSIESGCRLDTRALVFIGIPPFSKGLLLDSSTTLTVDCTPNTAYTIDIDTGLHPNGINRRMYSALTNSYVAYDIYRDGPRTNVWGTGQLKNVAGNSGAGGPQTVTLYGRVSLPTKVLAGDYLDTLTVTLNF